MEHYNAGLIIVSLGKYGEDITEEFLKKARKRFDNYYPIRIVKNSNIEELNQYKTGYFIIIGNAKENETQKILNKILKREERYFNMYLLIRNMDNYEPTSNSLLITSSSKEDVLTAMQILTYIHMKPGIICLDLNDIWYTLNNDNKKIKVKRLLGSSSLDLKYLDEELKKSKFLNKTNGIVINVMGNENISLSVANRIVEKFQNICNKNAKISFYITTVKCMNENEIKISILYSYEGRNRSGRKE